MNVIRDNFNKKGQGIVEYALILAFVVGIALSMNGTSIGDAANELYKYVARALGAVNNYESAVAHWGGMSKEELSQIDNKERLSIDQEALDNLAGFFIGKSRDYMKGLLVNDGLANTNKVFNLGWLQNNEQGATVFTLQSENFEAAAQADINAHVFNWLQGDYGSFSGGIIDPDSYNKSYAENTRYLYSDYSLGNDVGNTFQSGSNTYNRGGVKVKLKYENNTVVAAKVTIDSLNKGHSSDSNNSSYGLNTTVYKDGTTNHDNNFNVNF